MSDKELILRLGGVTKVAYMLGVSTSVVGNWMKRGIPARVKLNHPELFAAEPIDQEGAFRPSKPSHEQQVAYREDAREQMRLQTIARGGL